MYRHFIILWFVVFASGCATYGNDIQTALTYAQSGQPDKAAQEFEKVVQPDGSDRLLYYMELGVLKHLNGEYEQSNRLLEEAERLVEEFYTQSVSEALMVAMSNPTIADYKGQVFEDVYINYYKALNYLFLAEQASGRIQRSELLDSALVEARRLDNKLTKLKNERGSYQDAEDKEEQTFTQILSLFEKLLGNYIDEDKLIFRENAYSHYLSGLLYEQQKEWDDARISYQKAAELYEKGYAKQVGVGDDMVGQAWLDTIRMMQKAGGWDSSISKLKWEKLDDDLRDKLREYKNSDAELVVLNHLDFVPQKKELNFVMYVEPSRQEMVLTPLLTGAGQESSDKYAWFWMMYADKGILDVVERYSNGGLDNVVRTLINKRVILGPAWDLVESLNIDTALRDGGVRVAVPYYPPVRSVTDQNILSVNGLEYPLVKAESLARLALNEQILKARTDLYEALARETLKNTLLVESASSALGEDNALINYGLKALTATTARADTRTWLTLPAEVHVVRVPMVAGEYNLSLSNTFSRGRGIVSADQMVKLEKGQIHVWRQRSFPQLSHVEQQTLIQEESEPESNAFSAFGKYLN
ncbi:hypothetical protein [Litoribrevibacter albus]|uniref:Tetratricopeptide repeat protein n=1 Tax=Litoribrevibacter albus TaxID=1473156 RepID=A0AA37S9E4_9GAMM|nr:hypothetical protein [Litoribrevibacter albus]GLQ30601.1 hypothetical protein GCM10007876_10790 [Litoribrevibacter albus]